MMEATSVRDAGRINESLSMVNCDHSCGDWTTYVPDKPHEGAGGLGA